MGARRMPAAEVDVTPDLVRRLLAAQQPDLAGLPVEELARGWDNVMCRVGGELVARLPRRELAVRLLANEQRWLPVLQPRLPLPIPAPVRIGRPGLGYPWSWSIVPFVPGQVAARNPPADLRDAAISLGRFLAAPRWDRSPVWLHGDLHPANILVHRGRLSGVIDFGDITSGDPAADLSAAWMLLPAEYHPAFREAYRAAAWHPVAGASWIRARGWALALSLVFLAHSADNPQLAGVGRRGLATVLAW